MHSELKYLFEDKNMLLRKWDQKEELYNKCEILDVYYVGEQGIIIVSIDKNLVTDEKHAFLSILQKLIVTD